MYFRTIGRTVRRKLDNMGINATVTAVSSRAMKAMKAIMTTHRNMPAEHLWSVHSTM
jgi:hypothetical protein